MARHPAGHTSHVEGVIRSLMHYEHEDAAREARANIARHVRMLAAAERDPARALVFLSLVMEIETFDVVKAQRTWSDLMSARTVVPILRALPPPPAPAAPLATPLAPKRPARRAR